MKLKNKIDCVLLIGLLLTLLFADFAEFSKNYERLQQDVLRLHILANSDSSEDQSIKLKVRDELLKYSDELFKGCFSKKDFAERAEKVKDKIIQIADRVLQKNGFYYGAEAEFVNMEFSPRQYADITMPEGEYGALRVTLGEAAGQNWWCVMYPPLCLPYAEGYNETLDPEQYFPAKQADILKNPKKYEVRFKILEVWKKLFL